MCDTISSYVIYRSDTIRFPFKYLQFFQPNRLGRSKNLSVVERMENQTKTKNTNFHNPYARTFAIFGTQIFRTTYDFIFTNTIFEFTFKRVLCTLLENECPELREQYNMEHFFFQKYNLEYLITFCD